LLYYTTLADLRLCATAPNFRNTIDVNTSRNLKKTTLLSLPPTNSQRSNSTENRTISESVDLWLAPWHSPRSDEYFVAATTALTIAAVYTGSRKYVAWSCPWKTNSNPVPQKRGPYRRPHLEKSHPDSPWTRDSEISSNLLSEPDAFISSRRLPERDYFPIRILSFRNK